MSREENYEDNEDRPYAPDWGGNEKFIATLRYSYNDAFRFDFDAFYEWIIGERPSLEGKPFNVYTDDKVVKKLFFNQTIEQIEQWR